MTAIKFSRGACPIAAPMALVVCLVGVGSLIAGDEPLPEGDNGIAAKYAGDVGIGKAPNVVFVERFDAASVAEIAKRWESAKSDKSMSLSPDVPAGSADAKSLLITHIGGEGDGGHLYRRLEPGYDKLHYRFYVKFDEDCAPIHHFFHVGGYNPATPWPQGGAGQRPQGDKRFTTGVEPFGDAWRWDYYSYWQDMRGSPPRGQTWGNSFIHNPALKVRRGEWICVELMMKLNDVGNANGEMALWLDGKLVSHLGPGFPKGKWVFDKFLPGEGVDGVRWNDKLQRREQLEFPREGKPFEGFAWRTDEKLNLNFLWLLCYITQAPKGHVSKIWFDNIVVAEDYIGPITGAAKRRPRVEVSEAAKRIHNDGFVFDGHNDLPWQIRAKASSTFEKLDIAKHQEELHTDIPRLRQGNVGAQFWSVYVPAETRLRGESLLQTLEQIELVHAMCRRYPDAFELALTVEDIERIRGQGKIASLIGVEGGHSIENSLVNLRRLHKRGARYMTLTHSDTLDWADSATDKPKHDGLSEFGKEVVAEMNRLGMLVDLSHVSPETMKDAIAASKAPVFFSHSSARAVADHVRNVPDDVLRLLAQNGGVVMVNFYSGFIEPESARRSAKMFDVSRELRKKFPDEAEYRKARKGYEARNPILPGSVHDVVDHIDHIVRVAGIDHVGLGSDYDGVSMLPQQLEDVSTYPVITQELLNRGYKPHDIQKINSGNILRVLRQAEAVARELGQAQR